MTTELTKFESIAQTVAKNKPVIQEKIEKAIAACQLIQTIETDEQDATANNILVKCNATLPVVEGLRKEYTSIIDEWKKSEMALESNLKKEMDRLRGLRNERANRLAAANREKQAEIEKQKKHDIEVARIKSEQVLAVQLGIANKITTGEAAIALLFNNLTLANFDIESKKLDFTPKLKEDIFRGFIAVDYDSTIVPYEEFKAICDKAYAHFDYAKCDKEYCAAVEMVLKSWKAKLPAKKAELERIAKAGTEEAARLKKQAEDRANSEAAQRTREADEQKAALEKKAQEDKQNAALDAEFKGQIAIQEIAPLDGVRGVISYRLAVDDKPVKIVETMGRVMLHVLADPSFKGVFKRDKSGLPKRNAKGEAEYIDAVQDWLDLLAKIKPSPEFDGIVKMEDVSTVAKMK